MREIDLAHDESSQIPERMPSIVDDLVSSILTRSSSALALSSSLLALPACLLTSARSFSALASAAEIFLAASSSFAAHEIPMMREKSSVRLNPSGKKKKKAMMRPQSVPPAM